MKQQNKSSLQVMPQQQQKIPQIKPRSRNKVKINMLLPKTEKMTDQIYEHMIKQLDLGLITIPQQQQPLKIRRRLKTSKQQLQKKRQKSQEQLIQKLQEKRRQTLQKLISIQRQERQIKSHKGNKSLRKSRRIISQRSQQITKQQANKIQNIIKKKKQYDNFLLNQTQIIVKKEIERKIEQKNNHVQSIEKIKSQRRQLAQQKIKALQNKKQQRIKAFKQHRCQRNPKTQKYIFQINKQKQKEKVFEEQKQYQKKIKIIRQRFKSNIQEIKNHEVQYKKQKQKKPTKYVDMAISTDDLQNLQHQRSNNQIPGKHKFNYQTNMRVFEQNMFAKILKEQQRQKQQLLKQKSQEAQQKRNKINQFQKYVKDNFRPKTVKSIQHDDIHQTQGKHISRKQKSLSHKQMNDLGKKYLSIARKLKKSDEDQLIDYNPFNSNIVLKEMFSKELKKKDQFQTIISKFFQNSNRNNSSITIKNNKSKLHIKSEQAIQSNETNDSSTYKLNKRIYKDQKLYESVKNKLQFLSFIQ